MVLHRVGWTGREALSSVPDGLPGSGMTFRLTIIVGRRGRMVFTIRVPSQTAPQAQSSNNTPLAQGGIRMGERGVGWRAAGMTCP